MQNSENGRTGPSSLERTQLSKVRKQFAWGSLVARLSEVQCRKLGICSLCVRLAHAWANWHSTILGSKHGSSLKRRSLRL